jgi:hypothetical protein
MNEFSHGKFARIESQNGNSNSNSHESNSNRIFCLFENSNSPNRIFEHPCSPERLQASATRFMAAFPTQYGLGEEISVDLMSLNGKTALHVVDSSTLYSSAAFLPSETAVGVWQALMMCWVTYLPGFPRTIRRDSGPQFASESVPTRASSNAKHQIVRI